ncbi:MAG: hypothetical protein AB7E37_05920 [Candidatus Altimarinota bacterium]
MKNFKIIFLLIIFIFGFNNISLASLTEKEQTYYSNRVEQFFNKYDSKVSKLNYDEKNEFYEKVLKQASDLLSKTKNEKKVFILTKLIKTAENKKNFNLVIKQKVESATSENKVVQNYINSYTGIVVSNIDFGGKLSHKDQITANANSDNPQNIADFYLPNGELTYKNKEIFDKYFQYYLAFYPSSSVTNHNQYQHSFLNYYEPKYYKEGIENINLYEGGYLKSNFEEKRVTVRQYSFGSKYELEKFIMTTALPWIKYTKEYDGYKHTLGRELNLIDIAVIYAASKSNPLSSEDYAKFDVYFRLMPNYSILY